MKMSVGVHILIQKFLRMFSGIPHYCIIEVEKQFIKEGSAEVLLIFEDYAYRHGPLLHLRLTLELLKDSLNHSFHDGLKKSC